MYKNKFTHRFLIIMLSLFLLLSATSMSAWTAQAQIDNDSQQVDPATKKGIGLAARFEDQQHIRVIVGLQVPDQGKPAELMTPTIHAAQREVLNTTKSDQVKLIHQYDYIPFMAVEVDQAGLESLQKNPMVISIEEDILMKPMLQQSVPLINADDVWLEGVTGAGQVVAILDTGVDKNHPALAGKVVSEACYSTTDIDDDSTSLCPGGESASTAPDSGLPCSSITGCDHGTHVAGIVAADGIYNANPIKGVAPDAQIVAIQVFSKVEDSLFCGSSNPCIGSYTSDQILGLQRVYELRHSYSIASVNLSLGGNAYTSQETCDSNNSFYKAKVDLLRSVGIATIAASGNNGYTNAISSPACISSVISVGATTKNDLIASYSNSDDFLDLLAPGSSITSSVPGTEYEAFNGTSMATPHVAGAWALLKSFQPGVSVDELLDVFKLTGVLILDSGNGLTFPRIDVLAAKNEISSITLIPSTIPPIQIQVNWYDLYDTETGYLVERRIGNTSQWTKITITGPNVETFLDSSDLSCEQPYQYQVSPVFDSIQGDTIAFGQTYSLLCAPDSIVKVSSTQNRILLSWNDLSNLETKYRVEKYFNGSTWELLVDDLSPNSTQFENIDLACGTSYKYRITAFNGTAYNFSPEVNLSTNPCDLIAQPQNLTGIALSLTSVKLTWDDVLDDETGYLLERKLIDSDSWTSIATLGVNVVEWIDTDLEPHQTYDYRVIAIKVDNNNTYESLPSNQVSVTTNLSQVFLPLVVK